MKNFKKGKKVIPKHAHSEENRTTVFIDFFERTNFESDPNFHYSPTDMDFLRMTSIYLRTSQGEGDLPFPLWARGEANLCDKIPENLWQIGPKE